MRTTVSIDEELLRQAKRAAADSHQTVSELIEDALRAAFLRSRPAKPLPPLPTFKGGTGVSPGVDLSDNAATLAFMEEWDMKDNPEKWAWLTGEER